jgi:putative spermidine/putrescine transport system substrate-binding protein
MNRRSFLLTCSSLAIGTSLTGCNGESQSTLRVRALRNSLPPQLLGGFVKSIQPQPKVELANEGQFQDILTQLRLWYKEGVAEAKGLKIPLIPASKGAEYIPNLVSMGDGWLSAAIKEKLIQPIEVKDLTNWGKLDSRWQDVGRRDEKGEFSKSGQIWGLPYRWGYTVIVYRRDLLETAKIKPPTDWSDLWNPQLRQKISVLNQSRETIGLTLKKMGQGYNVSDISQIPNLKKEVEDLHQQVKFYSSDNYVQPLILGDTWVGVGWSTDLRDVLLKNPNLEVVIPRSGTSIWADLWVQPTRKNPQIPPNLLKLSQQWIDYCWQLQPSTQISLFTPGTAPIFTNLPSAEIAADLRDKPMIIPPKEILDRSEFLYPLSEKNQNTYNDLWDRVRRQPLLKS